MTEHNYYELLGLTPNADGTAVNRTYWLLARKYQALAVSDPRAHQMLDELNEAYNTLGTPALREAYDRDLAAMPPADDAPENEPRAGARRHSMKTGAPLAFVQARNLNWPVLGAAGLVCLAGIGLSVWTGSLMFAALGVASSIAIALAPVRRGVVHAWRGRTSVRQRSAAEPAVSVKRVASLAAAGRTDADELRTSTASMVSRWRTTTASAESNEPDRAPDSTLVDIFRSEHDVETQSEPLSAVLDVLRGSRSVVESK
jgi:hypothetical protein